MKWIGEVRKHGFYPKKRKSIEASLTKEIHAEGMNKVKG